jgi:FlaA1/EpsC-like NDP-sugar epimerase
VFAVSGISAFLSRFDFHIPAAHRQHLIIGVAVWVTVKSIVFLYGRMGHNNWRHVSGPDILAIVGYNLSGSVLAFPFIWLAGNTGFPRSLFLLDLVLSTQFGLTVHVFSRLFVEGHKLRDGEKVERVFIYGAGSSGATLLREIRRNPILRCHVCGFLDDDRTSTTP